MCGAITLSNRCLGLLGLAMAFVCLPSAVSAQDGGVDLASPETLIAYGDVRAVAVDGERSWTDDAFGKLRYGGTDADGSRATRIKPEIGEVGLVWQPRLGWALSGTVVALAQRGDSDQVDAGLSEAYLTFKPLGGWPIGVSVRAGLMWPPISLEHGGPEWTVTDTVTPSAIGSWIGEEVKVLGVEVTAKAQLGEHKLAATLAGFDYNDTAGALITFRGWAMHDRKALAFRKQPLPPLSTFMHDFQPQYSHPLLDLESGAFKRPGFYAKLAWSPPIPLRIEAVHYDNNGDPLAANAAMEWGWRTTFDTLGMVADLGHGLELRAQGLSGRTQMGLEIGDVYWIDTRFRSAYGMVTQRLARTSISARVDLFETRNRGSVVDALDDEDGWAVTLAAKRQIGERLTALIEFLHIDSDRDARVRALAEPAQAQNQVQMVVRARW